MTLFRGPGTLPKRMSLVLGSVKFIVTHSLCCFMGLSTSQELFLQGNNSVCGHNMKWPVPCLSRICNDPDMQNEASDPAPIRWCFVGQESGVESYWSLFQ